ncbi:MAG TPA: AAA family ATPase, partial [Verrucomicrobiae bacterium]|nr:AAA family ATPase [Verrucomicrobiae bacterium]
LPVHASTYNSRVHSLITSDQWTRFAFIERLDAEPQKHKRFYIDINRCRKNILYFLKERNIQIPVFTCMDDVKKYNAGDKIKVGFYFIESKQYFPFRNNGWYFYSLVNYGLENNLIKPENIKYKLESTLCLEGDYFNSALDIFKNLPYGLDKAGPNFMVGLFKKMDVEVNKIFVTSSFSQASEKFMRRPDSKQHIEKIQINEDSNLFFVKTREQYSSDYYTNIFYDLIIDLEALELHKLSSIIEQNHGHVTFLNTDCCECWFNGDKCLDLSKYFWDNAKTVLKYKYEEKDEAPTYQRKKQFKHIEPFYLEKNEWNITPDPQDNDFIRLAKQIIEVNTSWNINGIAGSGKSTLLKEIISQLVENKKNIVILSPTNKACRNLNKEAKTIHKFLSIAFENQKGFQKSIEKIDYILIDEISMVKEVFYSIFLTIKRAKPIIRFIIAGDWRQPDPVNDRSLFDYQNSTVLYELCEGNRLELTKCRRSDEALFNLSLNIKNVDWTSLGKENCKISMCFTNDKRIQINDL